jgi:hypothetical protein
MDPDAKAWYNMTHNWIMNEMRAANALVPSVMPTPTPAGITGGDSRDITGGDPGDITDNNRRDILGIDQQDPPGGSPEIFTGGEDLCEAMKMPGPSGHVRTRHNGGVAKIGWVALAAVAELAGWKGRAGPTLRFVLAHISSMENKKKDEKAQPKLGLCHPSKVV